MVCAKGDKWYFTLRARYIPILSLKPGLWNTCLQLMHVCDVPWPKTFVCILSDQGQRRAFLVPLQLAGAELNLNFLNFDEEQDGFNMVKVICY